MGNEIMGNEVMVDTVSLKKPPGTVGEPVLSGTVVTHSPAEFRFAELQNAVQNFHVLLTEAIRADDWRTLGYPDLAAWYQDVTRGRSVSPQARGELAVALQERDYSLRAIGGILHVTKSTVQRNIALARGEAPGEPQPREAPGPVRLRPRGRITLPVEVREALGAQAGDRLEFTVIGPGVIQVRLPDRMTGS